MQDITQDKTPQNSGILFPYSNIRDGQNEFLEDVYKTVNEGKILFAHAPTGIGKTAASLGGMLKYILDRDKTIFFLTPKHTQHQIVIETLKKINEKYALNFIAVDIIGKQWMCLYPDAEDSSSGEFNEFCKAKKEHEECLFFKNAHKKNKDEIVEGIKNKIRKSVMHSGEVKNLCGRHNICPYEILIESAKDANVIICDYFHIFSKSVREAFLDRTEKKISDAVIIVDESHNLPERVRSLLSHSISEFSIDRAGKEAENVGKDELQKAVLNLKKILADFGKDLSDENKGNEIFIEKAQFIKAVEKHISKIDGIANWKYDDFVNDVDYTGGEILKIPNRYRSYLKTTGKFLESWNKTENCFVRVLKKEMRRDATTGRYKEYFSLYHNCLDPSILTKEIFNNCHSAVLMSGTLIPLEMYKDILGIDDKRAIMKEYKSPFPRENKLVMVVEGLTTKYQMRSEEMFGKYAAKLCEILKHVTGNAAIFFSSYKILNKISFFMKETYSKEISKTLLLEQQEMTKEDRLELYRKLESFKNPDGAVLCAVLAGSLSEGVDYANNLLSAVIVIGLPLDNPDLEIQSLIKYYDEKFNAGWKYGYIYPAMNKVVQAAGRGIRSGSDKGVIILMDERYKWSNFSKCLPKDFAQIVTEKPEIYVGKFFEKFNR